MAVSSRQEARFLSNDEVELVAQPHYPKLRGADDEGLADLLVRLRERRDRARDVSRRQRREMRGRVAPSGTRSATDDRGTRRKVALLGAAVKGVNKERERRRSQQAREGLMSSARRALAMKRAADHPTADRPSSRRSDDGMCSISNDRLAPSGALDSQGREIAMRRGGGPR